jgi:glycosyltransferase involved in cell wall biosynthesis
MRVLLLDHESSQIGAGHRLATSALARGLASQGVIVEMVTTGAGWDGASVSEGLLTAHRLRRRGGFGFLRAALPVVRRLLQSARYDVAHIACSHPAGAMLPFLDLGGTPLVVTLRGPDVPGYEPGRASAGRYLRPLTRWIWRRADRIIVTSDSLGRFAQRTWPALRYAVIPDGVDLVRFHPRPRQARQRGTVRCLAVASLVERNGLAGLLRAVAILEPGRVELEIVGTGPEERPLRALAESLGIAGRVTFTGALEQAAVAQRYREADIFTLVTADVSPRGVFAEAMASGLPIVGPDVGAVPEVVRDGWNGVLVPPGDPRALAAAIRHLAASPHARAEMGRRNRAGAEQHLSWDRITGRHLTIYNGVRRRVPAPHPLTDLPSSIW